MTFYLAQFLKILHFCHIFIFQTTQTHKQIQLSNRVNIVPKTSFAKVRKREREEKKEQTQSLAG